MLIDLRTNPRRAPRSQAGSLLIVGALCSLGDPLSVHAESPNSHLSRLGFTYNPTVHDAAQKKAPKSPAAAEEPAPAGVFRLPKYTVAEKPVPIEPNSLLTAKGRVDLAEKRTLAPLYQKTIGPLMAVVSLLHDLNGGWNPNAPEAIAIYEDIKQRDRNAQMADLNDLSELADRTQQSETSIRGASEIRKKR
jgi:hypothetical protein